MAFVRFFKKGLGSETFFIYPCKNQKIADLMVKGQKVPDLEVA